MNTQYDLDARQMLNKVPEVTLYFWVIKIMATTVGETTADLLSEKLKLGLTITSLVMGALLLVAMIVQFRARQYMSSIYWIAVVLISVVGTLVTDNLVDNFGLPLWVATTAFAIALSVTFAAWYMSERTLSIHTIYTSKREAFYWAAILFTFALGTGAGDLLAEGLKLGYAHSVLLFGASIALVMFAYYIFKLNAVLAFWIAYILTRPLGASFGDLLSQPKSDGGLGLGTVVTSAIFLAIILGLVVIMTREQTEGSSLAKSKT